ncbi:anthranilate synthase component II [Clostridium taeniosporum]|uniref:Type 1 glutamine amidotransferase n=1 Tax=Clostridium taeniosporum TaxID=394958 RepID=A0A1D7XHU7_9CLOT|nr:aminodeoxychorismate/anthranilate synthase component II [Clostridium taeniosporum]AOR22649.1 type 1 glutamine amidotransferase [Clostridium taeniosporum]
MILMIDNYDSFTYNLVQYLEVLNEEVLVFRNNRITLEEIEKLNPFIIVLSPGPCTPKEAGICLDIVNTFKGRIPILGICLGHQVIGEAFGGNIICASAPVHGKVHNITHVNKSVFKSLKNPLKATRYHSLAIERETLPRCLEVIAETEDGVIMGIRHKEFLIVGIQYHPEAVLTEMGNELLSNFLAMAKNMRDKGQAKC